MADTILLDDISPRAIKLLEGAFRTGLHGSQRGMSGGSRGAAGGSTDIDTSGMTDSFDDAGITISKTAGKLNKTFAGIDSSARSITTSLMIAGNSMTTNAKRAEAISRMTEQAENKYLDKMTASVMGFSKDLQSQSKLNSAVFGQLSEAMESGGLRQFMDELESIGGAVDNAKKRFEDFGQSIDAIGDGFAGDIADTSAEFVLLKNTAAEFSNQLSSADIQILESANKNGKVTAAQAKALADSISKIVASNDTALKSIQAKAKKEAAIAVGKTVAEQKVISALGLTEISLLGFIGVLGKGMVGLWNEFRAIAAQGMAGHFQQIIANGYRLGISSEKLATIFKENATSVMLVGGKNFADRINTAQNSLMRLGLNAEDAAKGASMFHQAAIEQGIDPKNTKAINDSMEKQSKAFNKLRAVTGSTLEEFVSLNKSLMESTDNQTMMLKYAPAERAAKAQELMALRQELTQRGLTAAAANTMIQAMQGFQNNKLTARLEAGARMQQMGGILGMGSEGNRANELMQKRKLNADEQIELSNITAKFSGAQEEYANMGMGQENLMNNMDDVMGAAAKGLLDASKGLQLAADKMNRIDDKTVAKAADDSKLTDTQLAAAKTQDLLKNAMGTPLAIIAAGVLGIAAMMATSQFGGGKNILEASGSLVTKTMDGAKTMIKSAMSGVSSMAGKMMDGAKGIMSRISTIGMPRLTPSFGGGMGGMASSAMSTIGPMMTSAFSSMSAGLATVMKVATGFAKLAGPIGIVVSLAMAAYDVFNTFGDSLKFTSLTETLKSVGSILLKTVSEALGLILRIPEYFMDFLGWIFKDIPVIGEPLVKLFSWLGDGFAYLREKIDAFANSAIGKLLGLGRSVEEKAEIDAKAEKANKKNAVSTKESTTETVKATAAIKENVKERSAEQYLGLSSRDSISASSLAREVNADKAVDATIKNQQTDVNTDTVKAADAAIKNTQTAINTSSLNASQPASINKPSNAIADAPADKTESKTTTTTTSQPSVSLADIHKVLLELLNETVDGNKNELYALSKLKSSGPGMLTTDRSVMR